MTPQEQQLEIQRILAQHDNPAATNEPVLMIDIIRQQQAANKGFPHWMYHASLLPVQVKNIQQVAAMKREGYGMNYIPQNYPAYVFRRNMDMKFEKADPVKGSPGEFIEMQLVKDEAGWATLQKARQPSTVIGEWCQELSNLPPATEGLNEDPRITIARLQGQLSGVTGEEVEVKRKPGRPKASEAA